MWSKLSLLVIVGLGFWSIFQPGLAGFVYLVYLLLFETFVVLQVYLVPKKVRSMQPYLNPFDFSDDELMVFSKYHFYFRYPGVANNIGQALSNILLATLPWFCWLLYSRQWLIALALGINLLPAMFLGRRLQPVMQLGSYVKSLGKDADFHNSGRTMTPREELEMVKSIIERLKEKLGLFTLVDDVLK